MRIRSRSLIIMLSQGLNKATTVILGIVLVRMIDQETFGTYRQALLVYGFLGGVLALNLGQSLYYFIPRLQPGLRSIFLFQTYLISFGLSLLMALTMWFGADRIAVFLGNPDLVPLVRILALYPFAERLINTIPAFMISLDRPVRAGVYSLAATAGRVGGVIVAFAIFQSLIAVMWAMIAVAIGVSLVGTVDMARMSRPIRLRIDRELMLEQVHYTWPLWTTALVAVVNLEYGKLVISYFFDPATYAVYSCGAAELPVAALFTTSLTTAIMPNLVSLAAEGKVEGALHVWQAAIRKSSLVIFPCFAFFTVVSSDFMVLLYGADYARAAWPFAVLLLRLPIRIAAYSAIFRALGRTKPIAISALIALGGNVLVATSLTWLGNGSLLSFVGPAIGDVVGSLIALVYVLTVLAHELNKPIRQVLRWRELGITMFLCGLAAILAFVLPVGGVMLPLRLAIRFAIFSISFVLLMRISKQLQSDEIELASALLRKVIGVLRR